MKNKSFALSIVIVFIFILSQLTYSSVSQAETAIKPDVLDANLLYNGDFDQAGFYDRPPNHYVADTWYEWWGDYNAIPEYINGGHPYHNECYPNPPGGLCHNSGTSTFNNSQGLIKYGGLPFIAGIYKPVTNVFPCTLYTFEIWNRNDANAAYYHPKIGIDPTGWIITRPGASLPNNCPPDGYSECPDPYIGDDHGFPSTIVWSPDLTQPAYVWGKGSLTVEALNSTISVWTYSAPDTNQVAKTTYWDYGSLVQKPFPGNRLPDPASWTPSGFIYNVNTQPNGTNLIIQWDTLAPASTQISYTVEHKAITSTVELTDTIVFMPLIYGQEIQRQSVLDPTPVTQHTVVLGNLLDGDIVTFTPMSRRPVSNSCVTEVSLPQKVTIVIP